MITINLKLNRLKLVFVSAFALNISCVSINGYSATATSNLLVTATVTSACIIVTVPVAFGVYDPTLGIPLDVPGAVTVTCTLGSTTPYVTLGQGANPSAGSTDAVPLRQMAGTVTATDLLSYELYSDALRTTVLGNTGITGIAHIGTGLPVVIPIYGRIPVGQNVPSGSYLDTVIATITF